MANINDAFPSNFLKASDLKGNAVTVTIDRIEFEPVGQTKEMKPVIYFTNKEKGLVLNKTNATTISRLLGSGETEDWHGAAIRIYPTETSYQGEQVDCIRVKAGTARSGNTPTRFVKPEAVAPADQPVEHQLADEDIPF